MTDELKPCPFCKGEATLGRDLPSENWAYCKDCGIATRLFETPQEAADAWNKRPLEDKLHGKIGKLETENKRLREALAFYAELDGNGIQLYGDMDSEALEFVDGESQPFGTIARDALKAGA